MYLLHCNFIFSILVHLDFCIYLITGATEFPRITFETLVSKSTWGNAPLFQN